MKKARLIVLMIGLFALGMVSFASANPSPNGPGQPGAIHSCATKKMKHNYQMNYGWKHLLLFAGW